MRLGEPLHHTGFLDRRFDRSSSRCALSPRHQRVLGQPWATAVLSSRALFVIRCRSGPSPRSVAAEAARRLDGLQLAEVEFADRLRGSTLLQVDRQGLQPSGVFGLQSGERGNRIVPALSAAAMISRTAGADDWRSGHPRGTIAGLAFGGGHGALAERGMGHGFHSEALRDGTASGGYWRSVSLAAG